MTTNSAYQSYTLYDKTTGDIVFSGTTPAGVPVTHPTLGVLEEFVHPGLFKVDLNTLTPVPKPPVSGPYWRDRQLAYPGWRDFADAYYWAQRGDTSRMTDYLAKIDEIKGRYPKPK